MLVITNIIVQNNNPPAKLTKDTEGLRASNAKPSAKLHIKFMTINVFMRFSFFSRVSYTFNGEYPTT